MAPSGIEEAIFILDHQENLCDLSGFAVKNKTFKAL